MRLPALSLQEVDPELAVLLEGVERQMGFMPNDALVMARKPRIARALAALVQAVQEEGELDGELKRLVALLASMRYGCGYCTAHTRFSALGAGIAAERVAALDGWERSDLFSAAERTALQVAAGASQTPNAVSDADFARLREHFSDTAIAELVAVIALFGFLNRWNATLDTETEAACAIP